MKRILFASIVLFVFFVSSCTRAPQTQQPPPSLTAEETAKKLSIALQDRDYSEIYAMMIPEFQTAVSFENFLVAMEDTLSKYNVYVYEKTVEIGDDASAVISMSAGGLFKADLPLRLRKYGNEWKVDAFGGNIATSCRFNGRICIDERYRESCYEVEPGYKYKGRSTAIDQLSCKESLICCKAQKCKAQHQCPRPVYKGCNYEKGVCEPR